MTLRRCTGLLLLGLAVVTSGVAGTGANQDPVLERGLKHSKSGQDVIAKAIASTNIIVGASGPHLVLAGAKHVSKATQPESIAVYLVKAPPGARTTPAAVPRDCRCIFVNTDSFAAFVKTQSTGTGRLDLNANYVLTFMLLHELGHLSKATAGAEFEDGQLSELNLGPSLAKAAEEDADGYAADLVKATIRPGNLPTRRLEATSVSVELTKLSWNMQANRSLDHFGATAVGSPEVFFDKNLSHPNLHWRVLRLNNLIQETPTSKELLEAFEDARSRGANPTPLYVAPAKSK